MLIISSSLSLPLKEIIITQVRAQGSGGQNVNKVSSAVQLRFDIENSSLPDLFKKRLRIVRDSRITKDGNIVIKSQNHRTFERNKDEALQRLVTLIRAVMVAPKKRKATKPSRKSQQRRVDKKTHHGKLKKLRRKIK